MEERSVNNKMQRQLCVIRNELLATKEGQIQKLKNDLETERNRRCAIESKYKNLRKACIQMQADFAVILESLQKHDENDDDCGSSTDCHESETNNLNSSLLKLNALSTELDRRFENRTRECAQMKLELQQINCQLENLDGFFQIDCRVHNDNESTLNSTNDTNENKALKAPMKRVSVKPVRLVDELIFQQNQTLLSKIKKPASKTTTPLLAHGVDCGRKSNSKAFYCLCNKKFLYKTSLMQHIRCHKLERRFYCHFCRKRFRTTHHLKRHLKTVHSFSKSSQCHDGVNHMVTAASPRSIQHKPKRMKLTKKQQKVPLVGRDGQYHGMDQSKLEQGLYCKCGRKFERAGTLSSHVQYYTLEWKFSCQICSKRFVGANYLRSHMKRTHESMTGKYRPTYGCRQCGKLLQSHIQLIEHRRKVHTKRCRQ